MNIAPVINNSFHAVAKFCDPRDTSRAHEFSLSLLLWCTRHCGVWPHVLLPLLKIYEIVCIRTSCRNFLGHFLSAIRAHPPRNNYCRNDARNKPRITITIARNNEKKIMRTRVGGKVGKFLHLLLRGRGQSMTFEWISRSYHWLGN